MIKPYSDHQPSEMTPFSFILTAFFVRFLFCFDANENQQAMCACVNHVSVSVCVVVVGEGGGRGVNRGWRLQY